MKQFFYHGIISGILAAVASVIYLKIYQSTLDIAFDKVLNPLSILSASILSCILISFGYFLLTKYKKQRFKGILNIMILVLSFASIIAVFTISLPLEIESPELFPGLAIPMHFFPALAYFAVDPFFKGKDVYLNS